MTIFVALAGVIFALLRFWSILGVASWLRIVGSRNLVTDEMDFSEFTVVSVGSAFDVEIMESSSYSVSMAADDNLFDYVEVSKPGYH